MNIFSLKKYVIKKKFGIYSILNDHSTVFLIDNLHRLKAEYTMDFGANVFLNCRGQ